jgi:transposase
VNTGCRYSVMQAKWACDDDDTISAGSDVLVSAIKRNYDRGMQLRYNYRLYPAPGQHAALARAFGCARVVFNDGLRARQEAFAAGRPYLTDAELSKRLTAAKATPERAWLDEVSAAVLQQSLADLNTAYRNFFASVTGKRKGPKVAPPRFKSRKEPTSQVCSACGVKDGPKPLAVREWTDAACGAVHDRDVNAARNIAALGHREALNACGGTVRPGLALAGPGETGNRRGAA